MLIGWYISWEGVYLKSGGATWFADYRSKVSYREKLQSTFLASGMYTLGLWGTAGLTRVHLTIGTPDSPVIPTS